METLYVMITDEQRRTLLIALNAGSVVTGLIYIIKKKKQISKYAVSLYIFVYI